MTNQRKSNRLDENGTDINEDHTQLLVRQPYHPGIAEFNKKMAKKLGLHRSSSPSPTSPSPFEVPNWVLECNQYDGF